MKKSSESIFFLSEKSCWFETKIISKNKIFLRITIQIIAQKKIFKLGEKRVWGGQIWGLGESATGRGEGEGWGSLPTGIIRLIDIFFWVRLWLGVG